MPQAAKHRPMLIRSVKLRHVVSQLKNNLNYLIIKVILMYSVSKKKAKQLQTYRNSIDNLLSLDLKTDNEKLVRVRVLTELYKKASKLKS
jgi:Holliday junction resolvase RusA-like endonuclease